MDKESIDEREKRELAVRKKEALEEAERKLKEKKPAGSLRPEGNTVDEQPKAGEEVRFGDLCRPVLLAMCSVKTASMESANFFDELYGSRT